MESFEYQPTVSTLWGGIGGGMLGFSHAGFKPLWGADDRDFAEIDVFLRSWRKYGLSQYGDHRNTPIFFQPSMIEEWETTKALELPDILIGSPPCKSFSSLAVRKKDRTSVAEDAPQDLEFVRFLKVIHRLMPRAFVLENLPKLLEYVSYDSTQRTIISTKKKEVLLGLKDYSIQIWKLNAKDFGTPQHRIRIYWVGIRDDIGEAPEAPSPVSVIPITVREAFTEIVSDTTNLEESKHSEVRREGFAALQPGQSYYGTQNNRRIHLDRVGPAITSHRTQYVHPIEPRTLTVRECARLMGFPDDFQFFGPRTLQFDQVGCGICPPVAEAIAYYLMTEVEALNRA